MSRKIEIDIPIMGRKQVQYINLDCFRGASNNCIDSDGIDLGGLPTRPGIIITILKQEYLSL